MAKKIEVTEDDLKKIILILKRSKPYVQIPNNELALFNLWRVSGKLADKLMRKAGLVMVTNKGRTTLKSDDNGVKEVSEPVQEKIL